MTDEALKESLNAAIGLKAHADAAARCAKSLLANQAIPLDERWDAYVKLCVADLISEVDCCGDGYIDFLEHKDGDELTMYDHFYIERHETRSYIDMYDYLIPGNYRFSEHLVPGSVDAWREKVLASGYAAFTYDW